MSTVKVDYFLRLSGRFGSSTVGAVAGASPNAGGALPNSTVGAGVGCATGAAAGAGTGAVVGAGVGATGCATSGDGVIH